MNAKRKNTNNKRNMKKKNMKKKMKRNTKKKMNNTTKKGNNKMNKKGPDLSPVINHPPVVDVKHIFNTKIPLKAIKIVSCPLPGHH